MEGPLPPDVAPLSSQVEAMKLLAYGLSIKQVARVLGVTKHAVSMRVLRAAQRLGTTTTVQTVLWADRLGYLDEPIPAARKDET